MRSMRSATMSTASCGDSDISGTGIAAGTPAYRGLTLAMLFAGFSTFSLLYSVQPLLPSFATQFGLSAEAASLAVSLATGPLAIGILFAGLVSDRLGRRPLMIAAMFAAGAPIAVQVTMMASSGSSSTDTNFGCPIVTAASPISNP